MKQVLVISILFLSCKLAAQDIHFSQFYMNPVYLNPALTGDFDGTMRFTGNQRSQWRSVSRPYNTIGISAESREEFILPSMYHAVNLFHDVAGDGNYRTTEFNLTTSYRFYLDIDSTHTITPAVQLGVNHRNIDFSKLNFDNQFNGYYYDPTLPTGEIFGSAKRTGLNLNLGVLYTWRPSHRMELVTGAGLFNIPQMKQSLYGDDLVKRDRRILFHAKGTYKLNFEWDLQPGLFMQLQGDYKEIIFGSNARYIIKDKQGEFIAPYGGVWFRNKDAAYMVVGLYYNSWIAGISYDFNVSQLLPASNVRGGLEFSVQYILNIFKPKEIGHRVCPDYL
ncbi:MAG: PorP/SprF family type IX secretion system membrane protein [Crocinitomicaceae bacterium]|nr:PorP/SprF family type IX secretion system membrane protein [Crocinitomicaceae bacterium]